MTLSRFAKYAWGVLAYNIAVILWGAFVRATGSGAGCGTHWPTCDGEIIPRGLQAEKLIEFVHRASSGLALLAVVGLVGWAWRAYPRGHRVRWGAGLSLLFILIEALLGAGLVLFELVLHNDSIARAISMPVHLGNTFILLAMLTLTAWWASGGAALRVRGQGRVGVVLLVAFIGMLLLGMTGAVTALGDTLFPAGTLAEGLQQDASPTAHFLIRLRVIHPLLAVILGAYVAFVAEYVIVPQRAGPFVRRAARALTIVFLVQVGVGVLNLLLLVPVALQLIHLLLADVTWMALVLLGATALAEN